MVKQHKKLSNLHYLVDKGKVEKAKKKALKMGYETKSIDRGVAHFQKDDHNVLSIKGTNPTNFRDLASDLKIGIGLTSKDKQFKERKKKVKKILKTIPKEQSVNISGHSLGGSIATSMMAQSKSIRDKVDKVDNFNTGYTKAFHAEIKKDITPAVRKELNSKITHHVVSGDVISEPLRSGAVGAVKTYKGDKDASLLQRHSLSSNFGGD